MAPAGIRIAALLALAVAAAAAWSAMLGGFAIRALPLGVVIAAAAAARSRRPAAVALAATILAAPLLAGVPAGDLGPGAWAALPARLVGGVRQLTALGTAPVGHDPWALATGLLLAAAAWSAAAALAAERRPLAAVVVGAAPWLAAIAVGPTDAAVWQGVAVVLAGVTWCASTRIAAPAAVALATGVALVAAVAAYAVAPRHRWVHLPGSFGHARSRFEAMTTEPTFGPLEDRRSGAPMLEIGAAAPALWRLQALDVFDGVGWRAAKPGPELPQPAAEPVRIGVRVRGLRNELIASPGRIQRVEAHGSIHHAPGEARWLASAPPAGSVYHVTAGVVRASIEQLRTAPPPRDPRLLAYTQLGWPARSADRPPPALRFGPITLPLPPSLLEPVEVPGLPVDLPLFGEPVSARVRARVDATPYRPVAALARRLTAGAGTEWEVVDRVMRYLLDGNRFRYTTDVAAPGRLPVKDFLLRDRAGYCQHFASAAALLLRLAGVPARMVAGFATGVRARGHYLVRDLDAHDWIEVYFPGYGWVPFNPTPPAAPATIPSALELLSPHASPAPAGAAGLGGAIAAIVAALGGLAFATARLRRDPVPLGDRLERLLGAPGEGTGPARTLRRLADELERRVGPHTSGLALAAEHERFAAEPPAAAQRPAALRVTRALARDLGPWRAALLLARRRSGGRWA
jgi:transglutaminase-like putative cysteine protease